MLYPTCTEQPHIEAKSALIKVCKSSKFCFLLTFNSPINGSTNPSPSINSCHSSIAAEPAGEL